MKYIKKLNINFNDWEEYENKLDLFIGHENFYNFLKDQKTIDKFIDEFYNTIKKNIFWAKEYWALYYNGYTIKDYLDNNATNEYINSLCDWDASIYGKDFWVYIYEQWSYKS